MSLDKIITITISENSLQMSQTGFGVPLIIAQHDFWNERVKSISQMSDLPDSLKSEMVLYKAVKSILSQNPKVEKIKIGKHLPAENVLQAFNNIKAADSDFYGVLCLSNKAEEIQKLAERIETERLLMGVDYHDDLKEVAAECLSQKLRRVFFIQAHDEDFPAAAWMGKMLPQAPGSASWAFKELVGVKTANLVQTEGVNRYITIKNVGVTLDGRVAGGEWIDIVHGIDWLHVRIQERLFRVLMLNPKIPYTLKGVDLVRSEIMAQLKEGINRGLLAADPEPQISIPAIESIDSAVRGKRILPDVRFSARLAGAVHAIEIYGAVTA